ncbi:hypothetical protein LTR94_024835 [Friedmanniomyces endolithicus]|nr:hypothetical protein LTR94_024835 [Friedmanniomyces endolithicus]
MTRRRLERLLSRSTAVALVAALGACQDADPAPPVAPPEPKAAPEAAPSVGYACESGETVQAAYPDSATVRIDYKGQAHTLRTVQAASGARYIRSGLEWWTASRDGQESATLNRLGPDNQTGVAVLERCSRPVGSAGPSLGPAGETITPPGQGQVAAPGGILPAAAPCKTAQLKLAAESGDAGAGNRVRNISFQNIGSVACSLTGYPDVASPGSYFTQGAAPTPSTLAPNAKAYFEIAWSVVPNEGAGQTQCPSATALRISPPGDAAHGDLALAFQPCGGRIRVSPVRSEAPPQNT